MFAIRPISKSSQSLSNHFGLTEGIRKPFQQLPIFTNRKRVKVSIMEVHDSSANEISVEGKQMEAHYVLSLFIYEINS